MAPMINHRADQAFSSGGTSAVRQDIQALRGFAVLAVVLFHAHLQALAGGYLGVDVFFVISGFLITKLISSSIEKETFSFAEFYFRRAKRLLPAAYATFAVSAIAALFLLTSQELVDFSRQLMGGLTFTANMVLWRQGTYFGGESDLKPLLHIWSLSIEEQYYFFVPAVLFFTPRRWWFRLMLLGCVGSLALCYVFYQIQAGAAFYLFPARAWEMCVGSLGAFVFHRTEIRSLTRKLFFPAVFLLSLVVIRPFGGMHPGIDSWLACGATLCILLADWQAPFHSFAGRTLAWFGDISYSLYLVHWPFFAFLGNIWIDDAQPPLFLRVACILISIIVGYLQYKYVENPARHVKFNLSRKRVNAGLAFSVVIFIIAWALPLMNQRSNEHFIEARRGNTGFGPACVFKDAFSVSPECENGPRPDIFIWGDSNAMHLVPGIDATRGQHAIMQATKYVCGPLIGIAPVGVFTASDQTERWAKTCIDFNDSVMSFLSKTKSIKTVVLSSYFSQYISLNKFALIGRSGVVIPQDQLEHITAAKMAVAKTVRAIRELGLRVVIVAPPPAMDFDTGRCVERLERGFVSFGRYKDCAPSTADIERKRRFVYDLLSDIQKSNDVSVIMFNQDLTVDGKIAPAFNHENIFIANAHLSYTGSVHVAVKANLVNKILTLAR